MNFFTTKNYNYFGCLSTKYNENTVLHNETIVLNAIYTTKSSVKKLSDIQCYAISISIVQNINIQDQSHMVLPGRVITELKAGQSPTRSPPGMRKHDCAFLTYLQTSYAIAT